MRITIVKSLYPCVVMAVALAGCAATPSAQLSPPDRAYPDYERQQAEIKALNDSGTQPVRSFALAKAQCWLDVSFHEFTRNDRSAFPREALAQSRLITAELKASGQSASAQQTPLVDGAVRLRSDLWERAGAVQGGQGAACAAQALACAEVELVHAGHEV